MKIAIFKTYIEPFGGTTRLIVNYVKNSKHKIDVYGLYVGTHGLLSQIIGISNVYYVYEWSQKGSTSHILRRFSAIKRIFREDEYDVGIMLIGQVFSELSFAQKYRIPLIAYIQGAFRFLDELHCKPGVCDILPYIYGIHLQALLSKCKVVLTHSNFTRELLRKYMPHFSKPIHVLHPGIDTVKYAPSNTYENYFLTVSRIDPLKKVDLIINAFAYAINKLNINMKLIIAGFVDQKNGAYLSRLQTLANQYPVEFMLNSTENELVELYKHAYAFIFASDNEPFGLTPLEAMSCGKPVIAAVNSGGVLDYLKNNINGIRVSPDAVELAKAMHRLAKNKDLLKNLCINARKTALNYDVRLFAYRLDTLLENVCTTPINRK